LHCFQDTATLSLISWTLQICLCIRRCRSFGSVRWSLPQGN